MSGTWQLRINTTFDNQNKQYSLGLFNNPLVAIKVTSADALPTWRKGGSVSQSLILDGTKTAFTAQQELTLDKLSVYEFPYPTSAEYELVYFTLFRLSQVKIEVWEYTGEIKNALAEKIITAFESQPLSVQLSSEVTAQLTTLQTQIENLMGLYTSNAQSGTDLYYQSKKTLSVGSNLLLNPDPKRKGLIITNTSTEEDVLLGLVSPVNLSTYFVRIPPNTSYSFDAPYTGEVAVYSSVAGINIMIDEFGSTSVVS